MIEALIAYRMKTQAEEEGILPNSHYGGRPQWSTEDALTHLTTWTCNQWAKGRYVGALFVDVKAAFPTVNPVSTASKHPAQTGFSTLHGTPDISLSTSLEEWSWVGVVKPLSRIVVVSRDTTNYGY